MCRLKTPPCLRPERTHEGVLNLHIGKFSVCQAKEVNGTLLLVTKWTDCMSYEFELREDANCLCRKEGSGIKAALWTTIENTEHRMIHCFSLFRSRTLVLAEATVQHSSARSTIYKEQYGEDLGPRDGKEETESPKPHPRRWLWHGKRTTAEEPPLGQRTGEKPQTKREEQRFRKFQQQGFQRADERWQRDWEQVLRKRWFYFLQVPAEYVHRRLMWLPPHFHWRGKNKPYDECLCLTSQLHWSKSQIPDASMQQKASESSQLSALSVKPCPDTCRVQHHPYPPHNPTHTTPHTAPTHHGRV